MAKDKVVLVEMSDLTAMFYIATVETVKVGMGLIAQYLPGGRVTSYVTQEQVDRLRKQGFISGNAHQNLFPTQKGKEYLADNYYATIGSKERLSSKISEKSSDIIRYGWDA